MFIDQVDPQFVCYVCSGVFKDPIQLGCDHIFCQVKF